MSIPQNESELQAVVEKCKKLVRERALISAGASAVPIIGIDAIADLINMADTLNAINKKFGLSPDQIEGMSEAQKVGFQAGVSATANKLIGTYITKELLKSILAKMGIKIATKNLTKWVPIIGSAISAGIGYGSFVAFGDKHISDCAETIRAIWKTSPPSSATAGNP